MPVCRRNPTALSPQFISTPPLFISLLFISSGRLWAIWSSEKMNQSVKLLTQTSRTTLFSVFAASFMIHSHSVSPCTNRYVAFWWFTGIINKWILNSSVIHFAATADVRFLRLPSCTRGCQIHQECRILILTPNGHPFPWAPTHRHTWGQNKALPASPRCLFLSWHNPNASPLCSVKETEHIWRFWVVNSSHREAPCCRAPARYSGMWRCDFVPHLCPLAALPLCQLPPGLSPSQISLRDSLLAVQFIPPGVLKHCCLFTSGLRLLYVSNVTAASFISQVWRPWDKTDMALQSFSLSKSFLNLLFYSLSFSFSLL